MMPRQLENSKKNQNALSPKKNHITFIHQHSENFLSQNTSSPFIQRTEKGKKKKAESTDRTDVALIIGRPSGDLPKRETKQDKEDMQAWRATAHALAPYVFEAWTIDEALRKVRKLNRPIETLYLISHGQHGNIGELNSEGGNIDTVQGLSKRIKEATSGMGPDAPQMVELLNCSPGEDTQKMLELGKAFGTKRIRGPETEIFISGFVLKVNNRVLGEKEVQSLKPAILQKYILQTPALKQYDFVVGVPHEDGLSDENKMQALIEVCKKTGMIPTMALGAQPGEHGAVPHWKARVEQELPDEVSRYDPDNMMWGTASNLKEVVVKP